MSANEIYKVFTIGAGAVRKLRANIIYILLVLN